MRPLSLGRWAFTGVVLWLAPLCAQDVIVGQPLWFLPSAPPDELPKPKRGLRPDYPVELRKSGELGYVAVVRYIDEKGKSQSLYAVGTHMPFERAVEEEFPSWGMAPGRHGGQPVAGQVWLPIIFNPKSAALKGADASPRLLEVTPVFTPTRPTHKSEPPVVAVEVSLDASGAVVDAVPAGKMTEQNLAAIVGAVKGWRFAPARRAGQPVAAKVVVPVVCQSKPKPAAASFKPPRAISQSRPDYPYAMRRYGLGGKVTFDFVVDQQGQVRNPVVRESDNPAFEEPALEALRKWKFEPGTRDGEPVSTRQRVSVMFTLNGQERDAYAVGRSSDQSKLPPEFRYDTPARIRGVLVPVYPYALRRDNVRGKAKAAMVIDARGRVIDVKIASADRPEFGHALVAALEGFRFEPAHRDGKPVPHLLAFEQEFSFIDLPDPTADSLLGIEKKRPDEIVTLSKLDAAPTPLSRRSPVYPVAVGNDVDEGNALIECLIDKDGRTRLPRIVSATHEGFGYAALQAVSAWWFEPPRVNGKLVVARVRVPFNFQRTGVAPAASAAPDERPLSK